MVSLQGPFSSNRDLSSQATCLAADTVSSCILELTLDFSTIFHFFDYVICLQIFVVSMTWGHFRTRRAALRVQLERDMVTHEERILKQRRQMSSFFSFLVD